MSCSYGMNKMQRLTILELILAEEIAILPSFPSECGRYFEGVRSVVTGDGQERFI